MAPISHPRYWDGDGLTGVGIVNIISYWLACQRTCWYNARICLGETRTNTPNHFDLCYSFKMLCWAEYGGTHQLHIAAKNYARNYTYTAGIHQNQRITYERALRNLTVLMFSHFVHQLENSGSLEGHQTLVWHECLQVAAALGRYHRWQCQVNLQETSSENPDWNKVPKITKDDFRHKYSPALTLLGNAQNPAFAHPKLLGRCYDNVYFCGRLIGDLPARGRPPTEEQSMKVYTQEYQDVVARVENSIDLTEESPSYSVVPTSLVKSDIVLPHSLFRERRGLPEIPPGRNPEPREYEMDGARGLKDLDWSQWMPIFHLDDNDCDPRFTQYPFQEGDNLDDYDEEEMEVESHLSGGASDASMAPPSNTHCTYQRLPATYSFRSAETPGSPQSTHTDTDTAMEMGGLSMAPGGPDLRHVTPRASVPLTVQGTMSTLDLAATVARGVAAAVMEILQRFTHPPQVNEADHPPVDLAADAAIWECFQRCLATTPRATPTGQATTGRTSAFDHLGHRTPTSQEESKWAPHPEMTPHKIERGQQPHKEQESERAVSQKHWSQSRPCDEANPKKGRRESEGKPSKIQPSIDWTMTGIQKPVSKPDSRLPSSKSNASRTSARSTVAKESQKQGSGSRTRTDPSRTPNAQLGDLEKREIKDKPHRWIEARVRCLDPAGYMEEINSLRYFGRNARCFALQIVAIADWVGNTWTWVSGTPYPCSPSSCSLLYQSHTRADPSVGRQSQTLQETSKPPESEQTVRPGRSPLTSELLALDEELTEVLDYQDVEENDPGVPDPEITQAVAHIPQADTFADVEMQESQPPPGFEPEVSRSGYDVNLVRSDPPEPGSTSPVIAVENQMLDGASSRTPGTGRLGTNEDPSRSEDN